MRHTPAVGLGALLVAACLLLLGCDSEQPTFRRDQRVTIEYPPPGEIVPTPLELQWSVQGPAPDGFAVFVDRNPLEPELSLEELAEQSDECARSERCPTASWFAARGIYLTEGTSVEIPHQSRPSGTSGRAEHPVHRATIIPLQRYERRDGETFLRRDGEAFWTVEYRQAARR